MWVSMHLGVVQGSVGHARRALLASVVFKAQDVLMCLGDWGGSLHVNLPSGVCQRYLPVLLLTTHTVGLKSGVL